MTDLCRKIKEKNIDVAKLLKTLDEIGANRRVKKCGFPQKERGYADGSRSRIISLSLRT
jgi:hypothetical protein